MEAHKGILYKVCKLYQDREEDRQDLLQEILAQLWVSYDSFRGDSEFSSWMYRVALNTAIIHFKKGQRALQVFTREPYPDLADIPRKVTEQEEQLEIFYRAVQRLNKLEKALIFLYMEGRPGKEIAQILGLSAVGTRVRLNRVKDKLQTIIKIMGYEL
jgi:RNA polymerase sigma factor (sigma-70 family)